MANSEEIKAEFPLHWAVWHNQFEDLLKEINSKQFDIEKKDVRGRTPLMLAVTLGHIESARVLLNNEANVNCENSGGWTVVQEAVATGDPELLQIILERRDLQRFTSRMAGIPELLQRLKQAPDFYVEMKWEFTSWVPLVSKMCPSDTYKVYKQGANVRVDTTLLGFDHTNWQRGNRSYIFKGQNDGATMMEIDHDTRQVYVEQMRGPDEALGILTTTEESVSQRLTTPIVTSYVDTEKISFERNKAGMWGWRSDKTEVVNGYTCKVFGASNVEFITKTRTEHLTESDKARSKSNRTPLQNFLGIAEIEENQAASLLPNEEFSDSSNPCNISPEEYFDGNFDLEGKDIGRPKECQTKVQKFKANLWLSENYPLSLPEQILPIVDLMAISSTHFAKLKDFIQMQLPAGFPVKIEIPLFHVLNARITFGNIFALDSSVEKVTVLEEEDRLTCVLDDSIFLCPATYTQMGNAASDAHRQYGMDEDEDLLQFAIHQSLLDVGTEKEEVDIWEALRGQKPSRPESPTIGEEERELQRAIQASLELYQQGMPGNEGGNMTYVGHLPHPPLDSQPNNDADDDLNAALILSEEDRKREELQRERELHEEQQILERILKLSLEEQ